MSDEQTDAWQRVVEATEGHNIESVNTVFSVDGGTAWAYIRCSCSTGEAFTEAWEFTDHIRRIVVDAAKP